MPTRKYTTPTKRIRVKGVDLTRMRVWVTFAQKKLLKAITKVDCPMELDGEDTIVSVTLTQSDTAKLHIDESVEIQVNYMDANGNRQATDAVSEPVTDNLLRKVLSYDE